MESYAVVIAGSGPAGYATAIALAQQSPALARRTLILEKQRHPRPKLCGGGLTTHADVFLQRLGLIPDVPAVPIREVRFRFRGAQIRLRANIFRVIHRPEFDAWLANQVRAQGVELHEEEPLLDLRPAVCAASWGGSSSASDDWPRCCTACATPYHGSLGMGW
jgi:flavin-dependent dehydrogenase